MHIALRLVSESGSISISFCPSASRIPPSSVSSWMLSSPHESRFLALYFVCLHRHTILPRLLLCSRIRFSGRTPGHKSKERDLARINERLEPSGRQAIISTDGSAINNGWVLGSYVVTLCDATGSVPLFLLNPLGATDYTFGVFLAWGSSGSLPCLRVLWISLYSLSCPISRVLCGKAAMRSSP